MNPRRGFTLDFRAAPPPEGAEDALTVSQLTRRIKTLLEGQFARVRVEGEIGSISRAASGHIYLSLKDGGATLDAVIWRGSAGRLRFTPQEGDKVVAEGEITVYEPRGRYQMVISALEQAGAGDLRAEFEKLVARLREEGIFDPAHKRPLPPLPRRIGIVTSPTGAAIRDIIKVARKRWPGVELIVSPCLVQGAQAPRSIVAALEAVCAHGACELVIIGRGGGSIEDLQAFNTEEVARAVYACPLPVVSAVGHEVDVSLCDLAADARAATPSEAAEMCVPDLARLRVLLARLGRNLALALEGRLREARLRLRALQNSRVMRRPQELLYARRQRLDELMSALQRGMDSRLRGKQDRMAHAAARLEGLSPLAVLARGYGVVRRMSGEVVREAAAINVGEELRLTLARGELRAQVTGISE